MANIKSELKRLIKEKAILILGFGREGQSTYQLFRRYFPDIELTIADNNTKIKDNDIFKSDKNVKFKLGKDYLQLSDDYNFIIKTPGIPLTDLPVNFSQSYITSQTDIFLKLFSSQIIGITGTKGKSTTASLIYEIIRAHIENVILVGNIGIAPFSQIDNINKDTLIVYELSCHQLGNVSSSPHISVLLNLFQEHLDYYKTYEAYKLAKYNIHRYQTKDDYFIFNSDNNDISGLLLENKNPESKSFSFSLNQVNNNSCYISNNNIVFNENGIENEVYDLRNEPNLKGNHNLLNIMASIIACYLSGVPFKTMYPIIRNSKGLKHRLEYIGKHSGIHFYNDSIATIPEATIEAVKTLKDVDTLILGGYDRGIDYTLLVEYLVKSSVRNIILLGKVGERIINQLKTQNPKLKTYLAKDLEEAVKISKTSTAKGKICLLSPAAASYDMFKNFEDRGDTFVRLVKEI